MIPLHRFKLISLAFGHYGLYRRYGSYGPIGLYGVYGVYGRRRGVQLTNFLFASTCILVFEHRAHVFPCKSRFRVFFPPRSFRRPRAFSPFLLNRVRGGKKIREYADNCWKSLSFAPFSRNSRENGAKVHQFSSNFVIFTALHQQLRREPLAEVVVHVALHVLQRRERAQTALARAAAEAGDAAVRGARVERFDRRAIE